MDLLEDPDFNEARSVSARCFWYAVVGAEAGIA